MIMVHKTPATKGHMFYYIMDPDVQSQLSRDLSKLVGKTVEVYVQQIDKATAENNKKDDSLNLFLKKGLSDRRMTILRPAKIKEKRILLIYSWKRDYL